MSDKIINKLANELLRMSLAPFIIGYNTNPERIEVNQVAFEEEKENG